MSGPILWRARRARIIGSTIGLAGIIAAGVVYWRGTQGPDFTEDASMVGYDRGARRQVGILYGKFGELTEDLSDELKKPGTQAILIIVVSAGISFGCFCFARLLENEIKP